MKKVRSKTFKFKTLGDVKVSQLTVKDMLGLNSDANEQEQMITIVSLATGIKREDLEQVPASAIQEFVQIIEYATN